MNRRDFLKLGGKMLASSYLFAGAGGYLSKLPIETAAPGKIYRGTHKGSIHVSADGGKSWQLHINFGPDYSILDVFTASNGRVYAHTGFKQRSFHLVLSKDEKAWLL